MIPIGDDSDESGRAAWLVWLLIAANIAVYALEVRHGESFILQWAFTPSEFAADPTGEAPTLLSAMFMHAGLAHLGGNMLYLWIFGDNIQNRYGPGRFLLFYLACGLAATFAQFAVNPASGIPNLGASGAIAGVLGAYILLYPNANVRFLTTSGIVLVPAWMALGFWIVLQIGLGAATLANGGGEGGVAYAAHIGGFIAGLLIAAATGGLRRYIPGAD